MKGKISFLILIALLFISGCKKVPLSPEEKQGSLPDNFISAIYVHTNGVKYFATKKGLASFDGNEWTVYNENPKIEIGQIYDLDFEPSSSDPEFWLGTNNGVNIVSLPIDAVSGATTYNKSNIQTLFPGQTGLVGDSVFAVKIDDNNIRWFGTQKGISAFSENGWQAINWQNYYNPLFFSNNKITSIDCAGDTIYFGTLGGGVARLVTNAVDAVSAASPFEIPWSQVASNNILDVYIDGRTQWYGTDQGVSKHSGTLAKLNWESFFEVDGLINNYVQCINKDLNGNMWFGTKKGVSMFNGTQWTNYSTSNGLVGNNVLCIAVDLDGALWFGTDNGVSLFNDGVWTNYKADL